MWSKNFRLFLNFGAVNWALYVFYWKNIFIEISKIFNGECSVSGISAKPLALNYRQRSDYPFQFTFTFSTHKPVSEQEWFLNSLVFISTYLLEMILVSVEWHDLMIMIWRFWWYKKLVIRYPASKWYDSRYENEISDSQCFDSCLPSFHSLHSIATLEISISGTQRSERHL